MDGWGFVERERERRGGASLREAGIGKARSGATVGLSRRKWKGCGVRDPPPVPCARADRGRPTRRHVERVTKEGKSESLEEDSRLGGWRACLDSGRGCVLPLRLTRAYASVQTAKTRRLFSFSFRSYDDGTPQSGWKSSYIFQCDGLISSRMRASLWFVWNTQTTNSKTIEIWDFYDF